MTLFRLLSLKPLMLKLNPTTGKWWWNLVFWMCPIAFLAIMAFILPLVDVFSFQLGAGQYIETTPFHHDLLAYNWITIPDTYPTIEIYIIVSLALASIGGRALHLTWLLADGFRQGKQIVYNKIGFWAFR